MKTVWLFNSQMGCEYEYIEAPHHPNYCHSNLAWTGKSRPVEVPVSTEPPGPISIPKMPRINWAELGAKVIQIEPITDKED